MASLARIENELKHISALSSGRVGVGFLHFETGARVALGAHESFPMASTYKVAIAARLLQRSDAGEFGLDQMINIDQNDLSPGGGLVRAHIYHPGLALSIHNLLALMLTVSDNTSSDMVLQLAGGAAAVTDFLRAAGIEGMRVDRSTKGLITDAYGATALMPDNQWSFQFLQEHRAALSNDPPAAAAEVFLADPRDTSTPAAMLDLLARIYRRELLSAASTRVLLDIMESCESGAARIKGLLPAGTVVAHKTGTIPRISTNDMGIVTLPDGAGHVAISIVVKSPGKGDFTQREDAERTIAHLARAVYDFALFSH